MNTRFLLTGEGENRKFWFGGGCDLTPMLPDEKSAIFFHKKLKKEILESICRTVPSMLNYKIHFDKDSMFNTPPVFSVYACMLSLKWLEKKGGIEVVENLNRKKSEILYSEIDSDDVFSGFANVDDRSIMNVTFNLNDEKHKDIFDKMLIENNISGLNGHRSVGGYRASIYNAMDISSVEILIDTIKKFKNYI